MNMQKGRSTLSVDQFLFGSIVTITNEQMWIMILLAVVVVGLYVIFRKPLYVLSFDDNSADYNAIKLTAHSKRNRRWQYNNGGH